MTFMDDPVAIQPYVAIQRGFSTWLYKGLVNTDSIDWLETGAGGVRRKMIERLESACDP